MAMTMKEWMLSPMCQEAHEDGWMLTYRFDTKDIDGPFTMKVIRSVVGCSKFKSDEEADEYVEMRGSEGYKPAIAALDMLIQDMHRKGRES